MEPGLSSPGARPEAAARPTDEWDVCEAPVGVKGSEGYDQSALARIVLTREQ